MNACLDLDFVKVVADIRSLIPGDIPVSQTEPSEKRLQIMMRFLDIDTIKKYLVLQLQTQKHLSARERHRVRPTFGAPSEPSSLVYRVMDVTPDLAKKFENFFKTNPAFEQTTLFFDYFLQDYFKNIANLTYWDNDKADVFAAKMLSEAKHEFITRELLPLILEQMVKNNEEVFNRNTAVNGIRNIFARMAFQREDKTLQHGCPFGRKIPEIFAIAPQRYSDGTITIAEAPQPAALFMFILKDIIAHRAGRELPIHFELEPISAHPEPAPPQAA